MTVGKYIYLFIHGRKNVYRFDPEEECYQIFIELPLPEWYSFDVVASEKCIYIIGGASKGKWLKSVYMLEVSSSTWIQIPDMINQRRRCAVSIIELNR